MKTQIFKVARWILLILPVALGLSVALQLELPAPSGSYAVGRTIFRWVDQSRPEVLTADRNDLRQVIALVWYPAVQGTGTQAGYFPGVSHLSKALANSGETAAWQVFGLRWIRSESNLNAEPVKDHGAFPLVLLSPGNGTNVEFYTSLAADIASHGYVVVGLNHPYDVAAVELSDGRIAPYNKGQWQLDMSAHQKYTAERIRVRTADMLFALDQMSLLNEDAGSRFAGILDMHSVAAAGHSLGGITAAEACKADTRFKSCVNWDGLQAGTPFSTDFDATPPSQPFLFLTKEEELHPSQIERFESTNESYWIVIHGASHDSFTDGPSLLPSPLPLPSRADRRMDLVQEYSVAFLERTLKDIRSSLLSTAVEQKDVSVRIFPSQ